MHLIVMSQANPVSTKRTATELFIYVFIFHERQANQISTHLQTVY